MSETPTVIEGVGVEAAEQVLGVVEGFPYVPPGDYFRALIEVMLRADPANLLRLSFAYPEHARAVWLYKNAPGGREALMEFVDRVTGRRAAVERVTGPGGGARG